MHKNVRVYLLKTKFSSLLKNIFAHGIYTYLVRTACYMYLMHMTLIILSRAHDLLSRAFIMHRCFLVLSCFSVKIAHWKERAQPKLVFYIKQEMFQKHICPPWCKNQVYLLCRSKTCPKQVSIGLKYIKWTTQWFDLDLWTCDLKINRDHLLI